MPFRLGPGGSRSVAAVTLAGASLVAAAAVGSIFLTTARDAWAAIVAAGPADPADGILLAAGVCGVLLSLWIGLGMTLSALSALPGALGQVCRQLAGRIAPAAVRKVVAFVLGTTLTAALVPGTAAAKMSHETSRPAAVTAAGQALSGRLADAAPDASFRVLSDSPLVDEALDAAPSPAWSLDTSATRAGPASPAKPAPSAKPVPVWLMPTRPAATADGLVVHRGDTLWSIAARQLGPAASYAEIDAEWRRWLAANRDVIGDDANLILPGQLLRPPPSAQQGS